jgi:adenylate cyclase
MQRIQRRLAAVMAADVVGYSRLIGADDAGTRERFRALMDTVVQPAVEHHGGRIFKTMGDGILVEFVSAVDAVQCAADIQGVAGAEDSDEERIRLRIGIHAGDVIVEGDDLHGDGVNIAARLEGLAEPSGIVVSDIVHASVRNKLAVTFTDLGEKMLKNIAEPQRVFRVENGERPAMEFDNALFRRPAVAVLPFDNLSGDPQQEYFVDGLTEDLIVALQLWHYFPVIARNSTFAFKGQARDIRRVGSELGARYIVEGSVRKAGSRVRVAAQLTNTETGHQVWAQRFESDIEDIFSLQDEITQKIAAALVPELEKAERFRAGSKPTAKLDAWDCYLRGAAFLRDLDADGIARAREMMKRAIEIDPDYAKAYAMLGLTYHRDILFGGSSDNAELLSQLMTVARKAVSLDESDAAGHWILALANCYPPLGDSETALAEARRAFDLNPSDIDSVLTYGVTLINGGRSQEAIPYLETALRISPMDARRPWFKLILAGAQLLSRHPAEAEMAARDTIAAGAGQNLPENMRRSAQIVLLAALGHQNKEAEAQRLVERIGMETVREGREQLPGTFLFANLPPNELEFFWDGLARAGIGAD